MCIYTIDRVENKGTTCTYFPTYAVVSQCFGLRTTPLSAIPQQVRGFVKSCLRLSVYEEPLQKKRLKLLIPGSRAIAGLGPR